MKNEINVAMKNQGYYLDQSDGDWRKADRWIGPAEIEEMRRADMIDALIAERRKMERRNFKGY